jgi:hypothetical protein
LVSHGLVFSLFAHLKPEDPAQAKPLLLQQQPVLLPQLQLPDSTTQGCLRFHS